MSVAPDVLLVPGEDVVSAGGGLRRGSPFSGNEKPWPDQFAEAQKVLDAFLSGPPPSLGDVPTNLTLRCTFDGVDVTIRRDVIFTKKGSRWCPIGVVTPRGRVMVGDRLREIELPFARSPGGPQVGDEDEVLGVCRCYDKQRGGPRPMVLTAKAAVVVEWAISQDCGTCVVVRNGVAIQPEGMSEKEHEAFLAALVARAFEFAASLAVFAFGLLLLVGARSGA